MRSLLRRLKRRKFHRKLEISKAGAWFLLLTIVLGLVALMTGNNVIYLVESFLLAGLILSGLVSERAISSIEIRVVRGQGRAEERSSDWIEISNPTRQTFYSIEIGEWIRGSFVSLASILVIRPNETVRLRSSQVFSARGKHHWEGMAVATSGPFAFARKTKVTWSSGERIIWPAKAGGRNRSTEEGGRRPGRKIAAVELVDGEVRPYTFDDDAKLVVARLSAKGTGLFVRNRRHQSSGVEQTLDLRNRSAAEIETAIRAASTSLEKSVDPELKIITGRAQARLRGLKNCMNTLALIDAETGHLGDRAETGHLGDRAETGHLRDSA